MRYYMINTTRAGTLLRWFQFDKRRPWLDLEKPDCTLVLQLVDEAAASATLHLRDREGRTLPYDML